VPLARDCTSAPGSGRSNNVVVEQSAGPAAPFAIKLLASRALRVGDVRASGRNQKRQTSKPTLHGEPSRLGVTCRALPESWLRVLSFI
jgi:hypothetical protein